MTHRLILTLSDKNIYKKHLLCNCSKCFFMIEDRPAKVKKICPFCMKIGWCSNICLNIDIIPHVLEKCDQKVKEAVFAK